MTPNQLARKIAAELFEMPGGSCADVLRFHRSGVSFGGWSQGMMEERLGKILSAYTITPNPRHAARKAKR